MLVYMVIVGELGGGDSRMMTDFANAASDILFFGGLIFVFYRIFRNKRLLKNQMLLKEQLQMEEDERNQYLHDKSGGGRAGYPFDLLTIYYHNLLRGKIFCAHCGHSLHRQKCVRRKSQEVYVYHCISNNRIKKGVCPGVFIFEKELLDALADVIQEQLDTTLGQYSLGLENLSKEAEEQKNIQAKIASRKQEIQQLRTYQRGLYEGLIQNHLSKDEYFSFKEKYEAIS